MLHTRNCILGKQNWVKNWDGASLKDEASVTTARLGYRTGMNMSFLCQNPPKVLKALDSSL